MAENNSSAPLKTALPTNVEAFEHFVSDCDGSGIQYDGPSYEQGFLSGKVVGMDAAQAVAAQAAPAAVAVPDERWCPDVCPITGREFFMWVTHHESGADVPTYGGPFDSYTIPTQDKDGSFSCERYDHDFGGWKDWESVGLMLVDDQSFVVAPDNPRYYEIEEFATPALPATEDSSAGDLAEPTDAEIIALNEGERFFSMSESRFGKEVNPHTQYHTGEPGYLQFARAVLARWGSASQAQPADALDAARLDFLETQKRREARDGGYSAFYSLHLPAMAAGPWQATHGGEYDHKSLREAIDAAMAAAQEGGKAANLKRS